MANYVIMLQYYDIFLNDDHRFILLTKMCLLHTNVVSNYWIFCAPKPQCHGMALPLGIMLDTLLN
jgi:hypothetical protein